MQIFKSLIFLLINFEVSQNFERVSEMTSALLRLIIDYLKNEKRTKVNKMKFNKAPENIASKWM